MNSLWIAKPLACAYVFSIALSANASPSDEQRVKMMAIDLCTGFAEMAGNAMRYRQTGAPIDDLIVNTDEDSFNDLVNDMAIRAYEQPVMSSQSRIDREIERFVEKEYEICIKKLSK